MKQVQTDTGLVFDAYQWAGDVETLPEWLATCRLEEDRFYGCVLTGVGPYLVKPGSWVLRSHNARADVFPVAGDTIWNHYTEVSELGAHPEMPL